MLRPEVLASLPEALGRLYAQAEMDILDDMARRICTYDYYIPAAQWQRRKLQALGMARESIQQRLSRLTGKTEGELAALLRQAGGEALEADDTVYRRAGLDPPPLGVSPEVQNVLKAGLEQTQGLFRNLTRSAAAAGSHQFEEALDRAWMQVMMGGFSPDTAIRQAVKDLAAQGLRAVEYPSGRKESLEAAVRRAVVTGVNQACCRMQLARAEQMGAGLVETTAHAGARPSHAVWQGQVFRLRRDGPRQYPEFVEATGYGTGAGLGGWNCSHSFAPYYEGAPRAYSQAQLDGYSAKTVQYKGEKLTQYEAMQKQREMERHIRRWKREFSAMEAAGQDAEEAAAKLAKWRAAEREFVKQTGLKRQGERSQVAGFGRAQAQKAAKQANKGLKRAAVLRPAPNSDKIKIAPLRFTQSEEADKIFRPWTKEVWKKLSPAERKAAYNYTSNSNVFNLPLRGYERGWSNYVGVGKVRLSEEISDMIENLRSAIDRAEIKTDVVLFRGSDKQSLAGLLKVKETDLKNVEALNKKFAGTRVQDMAFHSTSVVQEGVFPGDISYEIIAPKGTKGLYAEPFSRFGNTNDNGTWDGEQRGNGVGEEAEVILQAGSVFEIEEIRPLGDKLKVILRLIRRQKH